MPDENKKKVDESWKERAATDLGETSGAAAKKSENSSPEKKESHEYPPANFGGFITSLGMQAMTTMGLMPGASGKAEKDLILAKYLIDTLSVIEEKTKNNLDASEAQLLGQLLYDLRIQFVESSNTEQKK